MRSTTTRPASGSKPRYYRNIPTVDLLPGENRGGPRLFGAAGSRLAVRAGLVLLLVVSALVAQLSRQADDGNEEDRADVVRATSRENQVIDRGLELEARIAELQEVGNISARDMTFLTEQPTGLIAAIRGVFSRRIDGIVVKNVETVPPDIVNVQLTAESNAAALEWRTRITEEQGVDRVLRFAAISSGERPITYDTALVASER